VTRKEFDEGIDGTMVPLSCEEHPGLSWSCKKVAISFDKDGVGRYNGQRNIFFSTTDQQECECTSSKLRLILEETTPSA
jgi:hypothetical protein